MSEEEVKGFFDSHASQYSPDWHPEEIESTMGFDFLTRFTDGSDRLLDIGCGNGALLEYAVDQKLCAGGVGIDISKGMLPGSGAEHVDYLQASATDLPFDSQSFDVVYMSDLLHHVVGDTRTQSKRRARRVLEEVLTLLRDDGVVIVKEQYYEGPVGSAPLTSKLIFFGLSRMNGAARLVDDDVSANLLVSFYTRDELVEMVERAGGTILAAERRPRDHDGLLRSLLIRNSGRILFAIQKKS